MRILRTRTATWNMMSVALLLASSLPGAARSESAGGPDFSNPRVAMTADAVIASGACIAKYAAILDDAGKPASEVGKLVANRCAALISRSAGMAALVSGNPDGFANNLKYMREELTTKTVVRLRAAGHGSQLR